MTKITEKLLQEGLDIAARKSLDYLKLVVIGYNYIYSKYGYVGNVEIVGEYQQYMLVFDNEQNIGKLDRLIEHGSYNINLYQGIDIYGQYLDNRYLLVVISPKDSILIELPNGNHLIMFNNKGQLYDPNTETMYSVKESQRILRHISRGGEYRSKRYRRHVEW